MSVGTGLLEELSAAVDRLVEVDPAALGDGEAVIALHRELERPPAVTTRAVASFDASGGWDDDARSAASWLAHRCRLPAGTARARVRLGRARRHLPVAEAAWLAGDLGEAQVTLLARARTPVTEAHMVRDEEMLVREAQRLSFASFARALAYWRGRVDPDGAEDDAAAQRESRHFSLSQSFGGVWFADGTFDPVAGQIVATELGRIEDELFAADWAEAKARAGEGVHKGDLRRSPAQRRADALVEMATRSATAPADGRRPEPLLTVLVGYETFAGPLCELTNGTMVTPASLLPHLSGPGSRGWSSTHPAASSTWACAGGCSPGPPAGRWRCATASASTRPVTCPPSNAISTTSGPGPRVGSPPRPTVVRLAPSTTAPTMLTRDGPGRGVADRSKPTSRLS